MSNNPNIKQNKASDPNYSVWVSASAGTGKTKILVDRLLRLLLNKVELDQILCLTFSKLAAAEMTSRLMDILSQWSILNDKDLQRELYILTNTTPTVETINTAKELFNNILDNPNGLNIQTIHSFCQNLLAKFPLEARISPNFTVIEEQLANELKKEALTEIISFNMEDSKANQETKLLADQIVNNISLSLFEENIFKILNYSEKLSLIDHTYNPQNNVFSEKNYATLKQDIYSYLNADISATTNKVKEDLFHSNNLKNLQEVIIITDKQENEAKSFKSSLLKQLLPLTIKEQVNRYKEFISIFLTEENTPRKKIFNNEYIKTLGTDANFVLSVIQDITEKILITQEKIKNQISAELNYAFILLALKINKEYTRLKQVHGVLDYDDLILKTHYLLSNTAQRQWVMYKLDQTIDHILVDEAQDTNPLQWSIIKAICEDFFAGMSAKVDTQRTIFVVGDVKQSIYLFQGADPLYLSKLRQELEQQIKGSNNQFLQIPMTTSFRSSEGIIKLVNHISNNIFDLSVDPYKNEELQHEVHHKNKPTIIEVWPPIIDIDKQEQHKKLALAIVEKIETLYNQNNISYGDMLILYKKRQNNIALAYIIKLLKDKNIPVLGIDKLNLKNSIIIKDLIALAKFLCQPRDDFSLACVLKSPLFGLDDNDMLNLTNESEKKLSLFQTLNTSQYQYIYHILQNWSNKVDYKSVFDLFFHIIYTEKNITKIIERLGMDVVDILTEFMNLILTFQQRNNSDLQSFLKFIEHYNTDISRDSSHNKDSLRLLTIHGSKGLQAKVVFLLNNFDEKQNQKNRIFFNNDNKKPLLLLQPYEKNTCKTLMNLKQQYNNSELNESKRLLYVAITRAEEQLYICSIAKKTNKESDIKPKNQWWEYITSGLEALISKENDSFFTESKGFYNNNVYRYISSSNIDKKNKAITQEVIIPDWAKTIAKKEVLGKPLAPSKINFEEKYFSSPLDSINVTKQPLVNKGIIVHKLLEQMNYINKDNQDNFVENYLNQHNDLSVTDKKEITNSINNITKNPQLSWLWQQQGFNEVSLSGTIMENDIPITINARIDKIIKLQDEIIIVDYKFTSKKKASYPIYIRQIDLYKKLLQQIYPTYKIRGFILFSMDATLVEI